MTHNVAWMEYKGGLSSVLKQRMCQLKKLGMITAVLNQGRSTKFISISICASKGWPWTEVDEWDSGVHPVCGQNVKFIHKVTQVQAWIICRTFHRCQNCKLSVPALEAWFWASIRPRSSSLHCKVICGVLYMQKQDTHWNSCFWLKIFLRYPSVIHKRGSETIDQQRHCSLTSGNVLTWLKSFISRG